MPVAAGADLVDVLTGLERRLGGHGAALATICTRVALRTGVDLRSPRPEQVADAAIVRSVLAALSDLGFPL